MALLRSLMPWRNEGLTRRDVFEDNPFLGLRREIDRVFEDFFRGEPGSMDVSVPLVDVAEDDESIRVTAELPGADEKDIHVTLEENLLTIRGEKKHEEEKRGRNYHRVERSYGSFSRSVHLPAEVDREGASATFKNGVLEIVLAKTQTSKAQLKEIKVNAGELPQGSQGAPQGAKAARKSGEASSTATPASAGTEKSAGDGGGSQTSSPETSSVKSDQPIASKAAERRGKSA